MVRVINENWNISIGFGVSLIIIQIIMVLFSVNAFASLAADVDYSDDIDLKDAISSLQICSGKVPDNIESETDVNFDDAIGLEEAIYVLQVIAGAREKERVWYIDPDGDGLSNGTKTISATRPSEDWYEDTELYGVSGDPDDNNPDVIVSLPSEIETIRTFIDKKQAEWTADSNPVSDLPEEERLFLLGALLPVNVKREKLNAFHFKQKKRNLPLFFDWRNNNGNFVTSVKNQGGCGSCWAFSSVAALESQLLIASGINSNLSEQIVVSCSNAGSCNGGYMSQVSNFLENTVTNTETCYPYTVTNGNCSNACFNWQNNAYKIDSWSYVSWGEPASVSAIKNALYENGPLVAVFKVYTDFFSYDSGVYSYSWGRYQGGHAILIVGWDDSTSSFIVKNSWGTNWGNNGYFNIAYSELYGRSEFARYTMAYTITRPAPDLNIQSFQLNGGYTVLTGGSPYGLRVAVGNIGDAAIGDEGFRIRYQISGPGTNYAWQLVGEKSFDAGQLAAGETVWDSTNVRFAAAPAVGGYYNLQSCVDSAGTVMESDESNNCSQITIYVYSSANPLLKPVYRFRNYINGSWGASYFYTSSEEEKNMVVSQYSDIWKYQHIDHYGLSSQSANSIPVYRFRRDFYSGSTYIETTYFYTASEDEKKLVISNYSDIWDYQGIAWYGFESP